jgi:hypothetical protein
MEATHAAPASVPPPLTPAELRRIADAPRDAFADLSWGQAQAMARECLHARADAGAVAASSQAMQDDIAAMLRALAIGDHVRPVSPHRVVRDKILPAIARLRQAVRDANLSILHAFGSASVRASSEPFGGTREQQRDTVSGFRESLRALLNQHSKDLGSDTPDFVLAEALCLFLDAFDRGVRQRERHYGRDDAGSRRPL